MSRNAPPCGGYIYISPSERLRCCSNVGLLFWYFILEMASGIIPGLVLLRELVVFDKLLSVLDK